MKYLFLLSIISRSSTESIKFFTVTDNDRMTEHSYLTFNEFKNGQIKVLYNITVKPNELSSLKYIDGSLYSIDDKTGLLYRIRHGTISTYDTVHNFSKAEAASVKGDHLYIYNYTKFKKGETKRKHLRYNLIKYNYKKKLIDDVKDLTPTIHKYMNTQNFLSVDINALDYHNGFLYIAPRYYRTCKEKKKYNRGHILTFADGRFRKIHLSRKLPKRYGFTDIEIYNNKIYCLVATEQKTNNGKVLSSIFFIMSLKGELLTDFIMYDRFNKHEGITIKP
jgi:hypothetical protein